MYNLKRLDAAIKRLCPEVLKMKEYNLPTMCKSVAVKYFLENTTTTFDALDQEAFEVVRDALTDLNKFGQFMFIEEG